MFDLMTAAERRAECLRLASVAENEGRPRYAVYLRVRAANFTERGGEVEEIRMED